MAAQAATSGEVFMQMGCEVQCTRPHHWCASLPDFMAAVAARPPHIRMYKAGSGRNQSCKAAGGKQTQCMAPTGKKQAAKQ